MDKIKRNIEDIKKRIHTSAAKGNNDSKDIMLVGVTKTRSAEEINKAIDSNITDIGENKVQELLDKYEKVKPAKWHMIGHLQTNKVKYIIDKVNMIHSLDSLKLANEIDKRAKQHHLVMDVLIQVNVAREESKFGLSAVELEWFLKDIQAYENIFVKGFMTIAPYEEIPEDARKYFRQMKKLFDTYKSIEYPNVEMKYLSMGMTNDFEIAIEEGANIVRIGTAIFGERDYK